MSNYVKTEISEQFRTVAVEFDLEDNRILSWASGLILNMMLPI